MYSRIKEEIKNAMKSKDTDKRDVLRMVVDKAKSITKEKNPTEVSENISDEIIIQAIKKEIKQLKQTCEALRGHESADLYKQATNKMSILSAYLPSQMSENEVIEAVSRLFNENNYTKFGILMRDAMNVLRDKADSADIKKAVEAYKEILN